MGLTVVALEFAGDGMHRVELVMEMLAVVKMNGSRWRPVVVEADMGPSVVTEVGPIEGEMDMRPCCDIPMRFERSFRKLCKKPRRIDTSSVLL